jgi:NAD(P)-dependent dehydrogenase (short-subunit alcohol dehydrogenase family)
MKKVIIWGSEGGIGQKILEKFQAEGWHVAAVARKKGSISQAADLILEADFSKTEDVDKVGTQLEEALDSLDVFVYAAGDINSAKIVEVEPQRWREIVDNNLTGVFETLRVSLPLMNEDGHVFILGAVSERLRLPGLTAYAAAKAGLEALVESLAKEERRKKISLVRPGAVATPLWEKVPFKQPDHSYSPEQVADRIWQAYLDEHKGNLDLV